MDAVFPTVSSHEQASTAPADEPGLGFQAAAGFYLGLVVTGIGMIAGAATGVATGTVLGFVPTTLTVVTILGHVLAKRAGGLPVWIGSRRRRRLGWFLPAIAFAATPFAVRALSTEASTVLVAASVVLAVVTGGCAFGLGRLCYHRYLEAITTDEPAATWTWRRSGLSSGPYLTAAVLLLSIVAGLASALAGNAFGLFWIVYGVFLAYALWSDRTDGWFDPDKSWNPPELRAHEAGVVVDRPVSTRLLPWETIGDVRLTDDELVLERPRRFDVRCDRAAIDDPEGVLEGIERVRAGFDAHADGSPADDSARHDTRTDTSGANGSRRGRGRTEATTDGRSGADAARDRRTDADQSEKTRALDVLGESDGGPSGTDGS